MSSNRKIKTHHKQHQCIGLTACGLPTNRRQPDELTDDPRKATCLMCAKTKFSKQTMKKIKLHIEKYKNDNEHKDCPVCNL